MLFRSCSFIKEAWDERRGAAGRSVGSSAKQKRQRLPLFKENRCLFIILPPALTVPDHPHPGEKGRCRNSRSAHPGWADTLASESGLVQNEPDRTKHGSRSKVAAEHGTSESYVYRAEQFAKGVEAAEEAVPGAQEEILSGKIQATDREISSIAKVPKEKRPEVVAELRKPKAERDSSITDSYSSPSKDNEFVTTFKQDIQGHKKGLNKEEKQNLKDAVKSIYSPRRLADGEAMMCEIQGAQEDFVRRWEMCFREYPDILTEPKNNEKLLIFVDRASRYLQDRKSTRLNSSHRSLSRMPSSA